MSKLSLQKSVLAMIDGGAGKPQVNDGGVNTPPKQKYLSDPITYDFCFSSLTNDYCDDGE